MEPIATHRTIAAARLLRAPGGGVFRPLVGEGMRLLPHKPLIPGVPSDRFYNVRALGRCDDATVPFGNLYLRSPVVQDDLCPVL